MVLAINVARNNELPLLLANSTLAGLPRAEYRFTAHGDDAKTLMLNGEVLALTQTDAGSEHVELPELVPKVVTTASPLSLPPRSAALFVYRGARAVGCA